MLIQEKDKQQIARSFTVSLDNTSLESEVAKADAGSDYAKFLQEMLALKAEAERVQAARKAAHLRETPTLQPQSDATQATPTPANR
jgi:hypothetical protein